MIRPKIKIFLKLNKKAVLIRPKIKIIMYFIIKAQ